MFDLRYRPGCYEDLPYAVPLLQAECESLGTDIWRELPGLILKLMEGEVVKTYVIDEGQGGRLRWFGLSAFVDPAALEQALQRPEIPFRRSLLESALDGGSPFLTQEQIGAANAEGNLSLAVLFCQPDLREYTEVEGGLLFRIKVSYRL